MNKKPFFPALEALRGLAALLIVFHHLPPWYPPVLSWTLVRNFYENSYLAVDFFFVLSGFVMALNYSDRVRDGKSLAQFAFLRAVRLYPVHFVFLILFLLAECAKAFAVRHGLFGGGLLPFRKTAVSRSCSIFFSCNLWVFRTEWAELSTDPAGALAPSITPI